VANFQKVRKIGDRKHGRTFVQPVVYYYERHSPGVGEKAHHGGSVPL